MNEAGATNQMHAPTKEELADIYALDSVNGLGPRAFHDIHESGLTPGMILANPQLFQMRGKRGDKLRALIGQVSDDDIAIAQERAAKQLAVCLEHGVSILTYESTHYPPNVARSNNPLPVLYARGDLEILQKERVVACVGSRNIRAPYSELHAEFCRVASLAGITISSGFALGADTIGHASAESCQGTTICVMPSGLDRPFPPENRDLWKRLLDGSAAVFVSQFPMGTGANSLNLRKRNKLIVATAQGVLVSQSAERGGAMNAFRFALEQKKPVATFYADLHDEDLGGNRAIGAHDMGTFLSLNAGPLEIEAWLHALS